MIKMDFKFGLIFAVLDVAIAVKKRMPAYFLLGILEMIELQRNFIRFSSDVFSFPVFRFIHSYWNFLRDIFLFFFGKFQD